MLPQGPWSIPIGMNKQMIRSDRQVLITGCYRTGSEYITLLLNNHPQLSASMYVCNFMRFCFSRYDPIELEINYHSLLVDAAERMQTRWGENLNVDRIINHCKNNERVTYALLYDLIMSDLFLKNGKTGWAEKTQLVWTKIPDFLDMFPESKVIHIFRDPRSVLASFKKFTFMPPPAYLGAIFNCFDSMKRSVHYREMFPPTRYYTVRYEDIIIHPEPTLINIFKFLGLSHDHDLFSSEGWVDARGNPWEHNSAFHGRNNTSGNFDRAGAVDRWKKELDDWEIAFCEAVNKDYMQIYKYKPANVTVDWKTHLNPMLTDERLARYYDLWVNKSEGIEEFPADPLIPENWWESRK